jgi:hypothetical protein
MHHLATDQPRAVDGRFGVRPLAEAELDLAARPAYLDLSDLGAGEVVDLANDPFAGDPLADIGELMAEYEQDVHARLGELVDDVDAYRQDLDAWSSEHSPEHAEAFAAYAMTELAAVGYSTDRVAAHEQLHESFLLERTRARAITSIGRALDEDLAQALLSGLDRSMYGTGPEGARRRGAATAVIKALRADGITVAETFEPGRGTVWRVTAA